MAKDSFDPKAEDFIDTEALSDVHPEAEEFIDSDQADQITSYLKKPMASPMESIREGYAQGGTFGFAPRMGAAIGASLEKGAGVGLGPEGFPLVPGAEKSENKKLEDLYNEYLEYNNKLQAKAKESNPKLYHSAEFVGAIASPANKIGTLGGGGLAAKDASMLAKMGHSALGGARIGSVAGLSQSDDLTDLPQDINQLGKGAVFGSAIGAAAPPVMATLSGAAKGTAAVGRAVFGPASEMFKKGVQAGEQGLPNLATEGGQLQAQSIRKEFAQDFVDNLKEILKSSAKNKRELIKNAAADVPPEQLDAVISKYLESNPKLNTKKALDELQELKEIILTAKEGPRKTETVRVYNEGAPERPLPSNEPIAPQDAQLPMDEQMTGMPEPTPMMAGGPPPVPMSVPTQQMPAQAASEFAGYEAIHKATVDATDEEAKALFKHKIQEKLTDEKALGRNFNNNPVEIEEVPIPGSDKIRLIAKRAIQKEDDEIFKEQAAQLKQTEKEEERLQKLLDRQQEEKIKQQQLQEIDQMKPQFQDVQQTVRSGGRNIYNPEELYNLQQTLQHMSQFREGRGFSSPEVTNLAGQASQDMSKIIKEAAGTSSVDAKIHAFNNVAESLGIDTTNLSMSGGVGEKSQVDAMNKLFKLINPENLDDQTLLNQDKLQYIFEQLKTIHPEMADNFLQNALKQAESKGLVKEFSTPYEPSGINWIFNAIRKNASKASYGAGHLLGQQSRKLSSEIKPVLESSKQLFEQYTPNALQSAARQAATSGDATVKQFGQLLNNLSTADERTRNSMLFVLQQQTSYRNMMKDLFPVEPQKSPNARDKSLDLYK